MKRTLLAAAMLSSLLTYSSNAEASMQQQFLPSIVKTVDSTIMGSSVIFPYAPDRQYEISVQIGYLTDLQFHAGEKIVYVAAGDTKRWSIDSSVVGNVPHLYIKPIVDNEDIYSTNLIVNTNERVYRLLINATNHYVPTVEWSYAEDFAKTLAQLEEKDVKEEIASRQKSVAKWNFKYKVDDTRYKEWIPEKIKDDGTRTYISIPKNSKNDLPTLHIIEGKKSSLVNYRISDDGNWFIVDRIFKKAVLYFDNNKTIIINNTSGEEEEDK